jgi:hypothetical protein
MKLSVRIFPSPGASLASHPEIHWSLNGVDKESVQLTKLSEFDWIAEIEAQKGDKVDFYIQARDTKGVVKTHPILAPEMKVEVQN